MANKETRILKSNTLEQFRQKANEISLHLGDNDLLVADLADKVVDFTNPGAGTNLLQSTSLQFNLKPEETLDNTGGYIILKGAVNSDVASISVGDTLTQSGGFSCKVVSKSTTKLLLLTVC